MAMRDKKDSMRRKEEREEREKEERGKGGEREREIPVPTSGKVRVETPLLQKHPPVHLIETMVCQEISSSTASSFCPWLLHLSPTLYNRLGFFTCIFDLKL
jgi:hypothetical protein